MSIISQLTTAFARRSGALAAPLSNSHFSLNALGFAVFFGGESAFSAMTTATVHVYHMKWMGWYNSPGSYEIAKRYGGSVCSESFDCLPPGVHGDLPLLFGLNGWTHPEFRAAHSRNDIDETGHLAVLLMKECANLRGNIVHGRWTRPIVVTVVELHHVPKHEEFLGRFRTLAPAYTTIPVLASLATCTVCGLYGDWYSFSMILLGIVVSGISFLLIGSGTPLFTHPEPTKGSPPGDGILVSDEEIVILRGQEGAVNSVTRGRFSLRFDSHTLHRTAGRLPPLLFMTQVITQLFLIPQGTLFGQIMFGISLAFSGAYNLWLSTFDEQLQRDMLMRILREPQLTKYVFGTRTSMVVFVLLTLQTEKADEIMNALIPNDTRAWRKWKDSILGWIKNGANFDFDQVSWDERSLPEEERRLLKTLFQDARDAYWCFKQFQNASGYKWL